MKKVLFIDYFFPPLEADWRAIAFSKYLPPLGWQPIFLSADPSVSYGKDYSTLDEIAESSVVYRVGHYEKPIEVRYLLQKIRMSWDYPDVYKHWYGQAVRKGREIVRSHQINLLYSASPAYTTAFVAMQLKKETGLPWVADFLDGWAVNEMLVRGINASLFPPANKMLVKKIIRGEKQILFQADKVVSIHPCVKRQWIELHGVDEKHIEVIPDGFDEENFQGLNPRRLSADRIIITFLGSVYPMTVSIIKTFLQQLMEVAKTVGKDIEVVFIGRGVEQIKSLGFQNTTCILNIPRRKCLEYALGGDFLFMVLPEYSRFTLTKTYDYLILHKPILGIVHEESDGAKIVKKAGAGFILSYDPHELKGQLLSLLTEYELGRLPGYHPDREYISQYERKEITRQMLKVFDQVAGGIAQ